MNCEYKSNGIISYFNKNGSKIPSLDLTPSLHVSLFLLFRQIQLKNRIKVVSDKDAKTKGIGSLIGGITQLQLL